MRFLRFSKVFDEINFGAVIDQLNAVLNNLTLADNFAGQKITVNIPANVDFPITHNLKDVPTDRIITRLDQEGAIIDTRVTEWSETKVYLKFVPSSGATNCNATILLLRG